jgi:hypothetical protein
MNVDVVINFEKYLLSQTKRSSQSYQLWSLIKRAIRARTKTASLAPKISDLSQVMGVSSSQIRNRLSGLLAYYQEYLAVMHLRSNSRVNALLALEQAMETSHDEYVNWAQKKVGSLVTEGKSYSSYAFYDYLHFKRITYEYYVENSNQGGGENVSVLYRELEEFNLIEKCKLYLDAVSGKFDGDDLLAQRIDHEIARMIEIREVNARGEELSYSENIYYHLYLILKEDNEDSYAFILYRAREIFKSLAPRDALFTLGVLVNRIVKRISRGDYSLEEDIFKLIVILIDFPEIKVTEWLLKVFITLLCQVQKVDFAEDVLKAYIPKLPNDRQEQSFCFNMAIIKLNRDEFEGAINLLNQVEFPEPIYYMGARFILFQAMFKMKDYEGVLSLTKSFKGYMKGLKWKNDNLRKSNRGFLKYFDELVKLMLNRPFTDRLVFDKKTKKMREKVIETSLITSRKWLLEEIDACL